MKKLLSILLLMSTGALFAQQDPLFSQYMFNKLAVNPGYTGSRESLSAVILNRWQWVGLDGAPKTMSASFHSPLRNPKLGLGLNVYQDKLGPIISQGASASFAFRIFFPTGTLSLGLQAGIKYTDIDWNDPGFEAVQLTDPYLSTKQKNKVVPDANFGVYYYTSNFYFGLSSKQLIQNQITVAQVDGKSEFTHLLRHFYGMAGIAFPISENLVFTPSLLIKYVPKAPPQLDFGLSFLYNQTLMIGASYRTLNTFCLMSEIRISPILRVGYSYDIWFNELNVSNLGSHELRIAIDIDNQNRMVTPRYF
jgi:type IX secretion system PorP/SprF family membrane protein